MHPSKPVSYCLIALLTSPFSIGCGDSEEKNDSMNTGASFAAAHTVLVANCTGNGTCHGDGTDMGMFPHPEFANSDEDIAKGYVDEKIDKIITRINSTDLDPMAFGKRRMPPPDVDPDGLTAAEKAPIQAYADSLK
jgi:hypothetical protein